VLIQRRALGKYHTPGLWANTCCTHPDWDEDPAACAIRRLNEELGITGLALEHRQLLEYRAEVGNGLIEHEVVDVYVGHAGADLEVVPNPEEVMDYTWANIDDLAEGVEMSPERYTPWLKIYLSDHADAIFGADLKAEA
jgi:isopentenyl-diphosphate delta-isomerase